MYCACKMPAAGSTDHNKNKQSLCSAMVDKEYWGNIENHRNIGSCTIWELGGSSGVQNTPMGSGNDFHTRATNSEICTCSIFLCDYCSKFWKICQRPIFRCSGFQHMASHCGVQSTPLHAHQKNRMDRESFRLNYGTRGKLCQKSFGYLMNLELCGFQNMMMVYDYHT